MIEYKEVDWVGYNRVGYEKIVWASGDIWYSLDGKLHREDGPSVVSPKTKINEYHLYGVRIDKKNYLNYTPLQLAKLGIFDDGPYCRDVGIKNF